MSDMIRAFIDASIPAGTPDVEATYDQLATLTAQLALVHPALARWVELPRAGDGVPMPFSDRAGFIERVRRYAAQDQAEYPQMRNAGAIGANLTTAMVESDWLKPGRASMNYDPASGRMTLQIYEPAKAFGAGDTPRIVRQCVAALGAALPATFIATDAHARMQNGEEGFETYAFDHQLFPHRRWLGWMGFVPHMVEPRHIPEAAELIPVGRKGTVIVAVDECFDLHNPAHLKRAHEVEARMAHLGLLEVTDTSLLS
ncbi:Imm52 family immunity protein [Xanthomonas translucens]|uniref:Imm52 family immunity protein n=2 Tax=Xanthomonas campestris pv. translucens TaxID=343 RepID=UPI000699CEB0|nr:Imm52 family immunity protein [Xanthomonas translucens]MCT8272692.1 immunity 52 family protein [Xanthomonas translucens pv. undulosa]QSQ40603.1 immunity 52 family protein [Xanthomonas translucens pv. translucens]QSQ48201.1 immunity 52 family protein [Xanthomonas translucens pv. undulosa]UJB13670.1 immunity 52 family protein [Xanthomonas translucens pv. undulosa]WLA02605.1 immunity 52 family protein [Xanthomonas translucens]